MVAPIAASIEVTSASRIPGVRQRLPYQSRVSPEIGQAATFEALNEYSEDQRDREVDERHRQAGGDAQGDPDPARQEHQSASNAPSRRAISRYTSMIVTGTMAYAAANGWLPAMPMKS